MNKEDILSAARKENKNHDLAEAHFRSRALHIGCIVGVILCLILNMLSQFFNGEANLSATIVFLGIFAAKCIAEAVQKRDKKGTACGIILCVIDLAFIALYISDVVGAR